MDKVGEGKMKWRSVVSGKTSECVVWNVFEVSWTLVAFERVSDEWKIIPLGNGR